MTEYRYTTADLASELSAATKTIRKRAKALGLGINLDGRAGYRYSEADRQKLLDSMKPIVAPTPRRKKRAA